VLRISYFASLGIFTTVERSLQIRLFMQNEPKLRKSQMNVNKVLTMNYEKMDTWSSEKNEPKRTQIQKGQNERNFSHNKGI
jgi:hypothetical protein